MHRTDVHMSEHHVAVGRMTQHMGALFLPLQHWPLGGLAVGVPVDAETDVVCRG